MRHAAKKLAHSYSVLKSSSPSAAASVNLQLPQIVNGGYGGEMPPTAASSAAFSVVVNNIMYGDKPNDILVGRFE